VLSSYASLLVTAALGAPPAAESCPSAQVRTEASEGHCCWEGQAWTDGQCTGIPTCPHGLVAEGQACTGPETLDPHIVTTTLSHEEGVKACMAKAFVGLAEAPSKVEMHFRILPDGHTTGFSVTQTGRTVPGLEACLGEVVAGLRFPATLGDGAEIHYPMLINSP